MYFDSRDLNCKAPFGAVESSQPIVFHLYLNREWNTEDVRLHLNCAHTGKEQFYTAQKSGQNDWDDIYEVTLPPLAPALYFYSFDFLEKGCDQRQYVRMEKNAKAVKSAYGAQWQLTVYENTFESVQSYAGGVMYQIFPDRFYASHTKKQNVPSDRILRKDWGGIPEYHALPNGDILNNDYFGGDLAGITQKLHELKSLGVTCLYLNPIFEAQSNHRYDTANYLNIDPLLGTLEDFHKLCQTAHQLGIKIILDGVFNHTGSDSIYFNQKMRYDVRGAYQSKKSRYYGWYRFTRHPNDYDCWWGIKILPALNKESLSLQEFLMGEHGVIAYWLKQGADGFRLDVADELGDVFLNRIHHRVKATDPKAIIIGEVWEDASNKISYQVRRKYLQGHQLDSVMNYPFKDAILAFLMQKDGEAFAEKILTIAEHYPAPVLNLVMNSISTHDTMRAITALAGPPKDSLSQDAQAAYQMGDQMYRHGLYMVKMAAALQFTLPGIPCIYYGDEIGMQGYSDPFNRGCFAWDHQDEELKAFYRKLGQMREAHALFRDGVLKFHACRKDFVLYERSSQTEHCLVAVNLSEHQTERIDLGEYRRICPIIGDIEKDRLIVPPYHSAVVIVSK